MWTCGKVLPFCLLNIEPFRHLMCKTFMLCWYLCIIIYNHTLSFFSWPLLTFILVWLWYILLILRDVCWEYVFSWCYFITCICWYFDIWTYIWHSILILIIRWLYFSLYETMTTSEMYFRKRDCIWNNVKEYLLSRERTWWIYVVVFGTHSLVLHVYTNLRVVAQWLTFFPFDFTSWSGNALCAHWLHVFFKRFKTPSAYKRTFIRQVQPFVLFVGGFLIFYTWF